MSDTMNEDQLKGYNRGYAVGRKKAQYDRVRELEAHRRAEFERQVFLAVLPVLVRTDTWSTGGKKWSSINDYVSGAWDFARTAKTGTHFTGIDFSKVKGDD